MKLDLAVLTLGVAVGAGGCGRSAVPPPPRVAVSATPVIARDVPVVSEWVGTLDGSVNADIRPKVEGYLLRRLYKEGQFVRAGDPLFEIDPRQFRAARDQAQGAVGQAEAQLAKASKDVERFAPLVADRAVSQQELDDAQSAERNAKAALASARATAEEAALNLAWTRVASPIDGIVGHRPLPGGGPRQRRRRSMTTVSTVDPIRVTYGISEREYLRYADRINRPSYGTLVEGPALELVLDDGSVYPGEGARGACGSRDRPEDGDHDHPRPVPEPEAHPPPGAVREGAGGAGGEDGRAARAPARR